MRDKEMFLYGGIVVLVVLLFKGNVKNAIDAVTDTNYTRWDSLLKKHAKARNVPWRWLKVILLNESSNGSDKRVLRGIEAPNDVAGSASSDGNSWGLMQLTIPTASALVGRSVSPVELNNPDFNVMLSAMLMRENIDRYGYDFERVFRAYNGGPKANVPGTTNWVLTGPYLTKSILNLKTVMLKYPGNELSVE